MSGFDPLDPASPTAEDFGATPGLGMVGAAYPCDQCSRVYGVKFVETETGPVPLCLRCRKTREGS